MSKNLSVRAPQKKSRPNGRLEHSPEDLVDLSWVETVSNWEFRLLPIPWTAPMITIEMPAAIRPYSIAMAPESSFRNARNLAPCGPIQRHDTVVPLTRVPRRRSENSEGISAIVKATAMSYRVRRRSPDRG
jgi:hypothetical protein